MFLSYHVVFLSYHSLSIMSYVPLILNDELYCAERVLLHIIMSSVTLILNNEFCYT